MSARSSFVQDFSLQAAMAGVVAALVGFMSTIAIVIKGLEAVGATRAEIISGIVLLCFAMGGIAIAASLITRMPIWIAWTTPGVALLAATGPVTGGFPAAVGGFMVAGALIVLAGAWPLLGRIVGTIPKPVANGLLAGILLKLCLAPFVALGQMPLPALSVILVWLIAMRFTRLYAVPLAVAAAIAATYLSGAPLEPPPGGLWPGLTFVVPRFEWSAVVSIGLPLFVVTMASQNITGMAVLMTFGYRPKFGPLLLATGAASAAAAPFGMPTVNLAAITAAICANPEAHADPARRYVATIVAGIAHMALALTAGIAATLVLSSSPLLIEAAAGLALIGALGGAFKGAVETEEGCIPALVTFLTAASGLSFLGIGGAFWGLLLGIAAHVFLHWRA